MHINSSKAYLTQFLLIYFDDKDYAHAIILMSTKSPTKIRSLSENFSKEIYGNVFSKD